jgi:large subunit ribosomal protein L15
MVSKTSKYRGSRTHGRGKKAGRGWGKRGGHGMAGGHKHKFIWILIHDRDHFGRHGFKRPQKILKGTICINIRDLDRLPDGEHVKTSGGTMTIDLTGLGFDKLLASGRPSKKFNIKVTTASLPAIEKIKAAGGSIEVEKMPVDREAVKKAKETEAAKKVATAKAAKPEPKKEKGKEGGGGGGKPRDGKPKEGGTGAASQAPKPPKGDKGEKGQKPGKGKPKDAKEA